MAGVIRFEDLDAWRLSTELQDLVDKMTEGGRVSADFDFCRQIRKSAASAPSNISEGWGRFKPQQNAHLCLVAKASLDETRNHLLHGLTKKYFEEKDVERALRLAKRARGATVGLIRYLESCNGRLPWEDPPPRRPRKKPDPNKPRRPRPRKPKGRPPDDNPGRSEP